FAIPQNGNFLSAKMKRQAMPLVQADGAGRSRLEDSIHALRVLGIKFPGAIVADLKMIAGHGVLLAFNSPEQFNISRLLEQHIRAHFVITQPPRITENGRGRHLCPMPENRLLLDNLTINFSGTPS